MLEPHDAALRTRLIEIFRAGPDTSLDGAAFDKLAVEVFRRNYEAVPAYAAYCRARGVTPGSVGGWPEVPAVPTAAFKELRLLADGMRPERVFRTSGTTRGPERRGQHVVADLELYRASLRSTFRAFLLPDGARLQFLSLMPSALLLSDSSLAFMISDVMDSFGGEASAAFADLEGLDHGLDAALERACADGRPVLLLGTSSAFVHWLDRLQSAGRGYSLPEGSRLMDTGGYKGMGRSVEPVELRALYHERLGLAAHVCVNEYGMTEMLSQLYDSGLMDRHHGTDRPPRKLGPPWVRTVAVDPETLSPLPAGETGLLRHMDLANLDSVAAIQTEDLGRVDAHGLVLEGRVAGAPPRGCSIAMDMLLRGGR